VIDLTLKDSHGIELVKRLAPRDPPVKMLVVSAHDENLFADKMFLTPVIHAHFPDG